MIDVDLGSDFFFFNHHQGTDNRGKANQNKLTKQKQDYIKQRGKKMLSNKSNKTSVYESPDWVGGCITRLLGTFGCVVVSLADGMSIAQRGN